jgi:adenylate kinase family enzyme
VQRVQRVAVVGASGSGKSTLARQLAQRLDLPCLELDGVFHQPGWTELEPAEFRQRVGAFVQQPAWVVDGNYARVRDLVLVRADTVVWLRLPRSVVMRQVVRRTTGRLLLRRTLWNGNRERLGSVLSLDPARSVVAWAWHRHGAYDEEYRERARSAPPGQEWVVLRSRREVRSFLSSR